MPAPHPASTALLRYFDYAHLPAHLGTISAPIHDLAHHLATTLPPGPEVTAGLRKLLEAKDCFVRAALDTSPTTTDARTTAVTARDVSIRLSPMAAADLAALNTAWARIGGDVQRLTAELHADHDRRLADWLRANDINPHTVADGSLRSYRTHLAWTDRFSGFAHTTPVLAPWSDFAVPGTHGADQATPPELVADLGDPAAGLHPDTTPDPAPADDPLLTLNADADTTAAADNDQAGEATR